MIGKNYFSTLILCAILNGLWAQNQATLTVNPGSKLVQIPDNFIGMSHEMSDLGQTGNVVWDSTHYQYVNYHKTLGVKAVRIGANTVDYSVWSNGPRTASTPDNTLTTTDVDKFFGFLKKIGGKAIFGLNFAGHFDPQLAAEQVDYIYRNHRDQLESVEIGNEPDFYHFHNDLKPTSYYYSDWKPQYTQYIDAIYAKVPQAPISGPTTAHDIATFTTPYANDFKGKFMTLTHHNYGGGARTIDNMLSAASMTALSSMGADLNNLAQSAGVNYKMSEMGSFAGGGQDGVSNVYASALWVLDAMYTMASVNCKGIYFHNANNLASPYTPIQVISPTSPTSYQPRPICYGIMAFKEGSKGWLTGSSLTGGNDLLKAYSVVGADSKLYVTIINKDASEDFNINLNPGAVEYSYAEGMRLNGSALSSAANVTLAGSALDINGLWVPQSIEQFANNGGSFTVPVTHASAVVLTLSQPPITIPGRVQAEDHVDSSGIVTGPCGDVGGGMAIGHISNGDYVHYDVNVTERGKYKVAFRVASATSGGTIRFKSGGTLLDEITVNYTGGWNTWTTIAREIFLEKGRQTIALEFAGGAGDFMNINWFDAELERIPIPGRVEAEDYSDSLGLVSGPSNDGGYAIGHISQGDWTTYEVTVNERGNYRVSFRVASGSNGGNIILKSNTQTLKQFVVPGTGGWGVWITISDTVWFERGDQTLQWYFDGGSGDYMNVNWMDAYPIPMQIPGKIEAEAYADSSGILSQATTDQGGGENIGWIENGDWVKYYVQVATTTRYLISYRIASAGTGGMIDLYQNNQKLRTTAIPVTGGWQTWQTITDTVSMAKGTDTLTLAFAGDTSGSLFNINWFGVEYFTDCNGDTGGYAIVDSCGICSGGSTGITPVTDKNQCAITGITASNTTPVSVFPNPFQETIHMNVSDGAKAELYTLTGIKIWEGVIRGRALSPEVEAGTYMLRVISPDMVNSFIVCKTR